MEEIDYLEILEALNTQHEVDSPEMLAMNTT
jgi:hypothetical protein